MVCGCGGTSCAHYAVYAAGCRIVAEQKVLPYVCVCENDALWTYDDPATGNGADFTLW